MKIYMAGGVSGNLKPFWKCVSAMVAQGVEYHEAFDRAMKIFLAGVESRHWIQEGYADLSCRNERHPPNSGQPVHNSGGGIRLNENLPRGEHNLPSVCSPDINGERECDCSLQGYPRGGAGGGYDPIIREHKPFILESFYYADADTERLLPYYGDFLLDSGAFTFCGTGGFSVDKFDEYLERYADFINRNHVDKFFELDVDSITGYEKVLEYRKRLERLTGKQPIPVWHISRGKEEFIRHCDEFPYIALGGYVAAIKASDPRQKAYVNAYPWFIGEAHKRGKKIHGLGYTSLDGITKHHFDSIDSTAWTTGNRFGYLYWFDGKTMRKRDAPKGHRIGDSRAAALHNYTEWIKFQKWAESHL